MQMISGKHAKSKRCFTCQEDMLGTNQVFAKVLHLLAEVWSRWPHSKAKSGKPGFPFEVHEEHDHEKDECKIVTCYKNLRFHAMSSKTWTWVPILENHARTNTKTWLLLQTFGSKRDFLQEHMNTIFLFRNQLQIDA